MIELNAHATRRQVYTQSKADVTLHGDLMHTKLAGIDLIAKKVHVKYHHSCKSSYIQRAKNLEKQSSAVKDEKSRLHSEELIRI